MSGPKVICTVELLADPDGTFGARWEGNPDIWGVTFDHANIDSVMIEISHAMVDQVGYSPAFGQADGDLS